MDVRGVLVLPNAGAISTSAEFLFIFNRSLASHNRNSGCACISEMTYGCAYSSRCT